MGAAEPLCLLSFLILVNGLVYLDMLQEASHRCTLHALKKGSTACKNACGSSRCTQCPHPGRIASWE